jgi:hypothetical protein
MTLDELLAELKTSPTDLVRFVRAAAQSQRPNVVVSAAAVTGWQERDPEAWAKVLEWLADQGKTVVQV